MHSYALVVLSLAALAFQGAAACQGATATVSAFSGRDSAVISAVPFIAEVSLTCTGGDSTGAPGTLYARIGQRTLPAARVPNNKYQISWTEELSEAASGNREIHLYTEAGYTALRKAMRSDQDISSVPSLVTVVVPHSTGYSGPWINSEVMAAIMSIVVAYIALTNKSRLLS
ncbi:translocon-associated protein delta [Arctopsyche grandis]|uniref:translocon-associated protein delta n=1 Tax=Arctopsyche grandis TaxID=121162 RepID=UPI00406D9F21